MGATTPSDSDLELRDRGTRADERERLTEVDANAIVDAILERPSVATLINESKRQHDNAMLAAW